MSESYFLPKCFSKFLFKKNEILFFQVLCNLYVSRECASLAKTKSALSLFIYWNAECCGALWTSMNTSNFLWQSALSMIAPWWFIKGYCQLVGCSSICCLGLIDGPGQHFSGSFLQRQLMIANYHVKKFVRKSQ